MNIFMGLNDIEFMIFNGNILAVKLTLLIFCFLSGKQKKILKLFTKYIFYQNNNDELVPSPRSLLMYILTRLL